MSNISLSFDIKRTQQVELQDPARVELRHKFFEDTIWIATFTLNCHTVAMLGPSRTFRQSNAQPVTHTTWIRTLRTPFAGTVDNDWLAFALEANFREADDVLAIAMQYLKGAPPVYDGRMQIGGDAGYGPMTTDGRREEGSDFNDYLGIPWAYPETNKAKPTTERPQARQQGCLDCSGYMRMIWGFRPHLPCSAFPSGVPLAGKGSSVNGAAMPRRAHEIASSAPGILLASSAQARPKEAELRKLQPGDLVFFNVDKGDGEKIDHIGMYLGLDSQEQRRFIHSPKTANGPTMGDHRPQYPSVLDGSGRYAEGLRVIRRL